MSFCDSFFCHEFFCHMSSCFNDNTVLVSRLRRWVAGEARAGFSGVSKVPDTVFSRFLPLGRQSGTLEFEGVGRTKRSAVPAITRQLPERRCAWSGLQIQLHRQAISGKRRVEAGTAGRQRQAQKKSRPLLVATSDSQADRLIHMRYEGLSRLKSSATSFAPMSSCRNA